VRVVVKFHETARQDLRVWARSLRGPRSYRRLFAQNALAELLRLLEALGGPPSGAEPELGVEPAVWWWQYYPQFWIRFAIRDVRPAWWAFWRERVRRITILRVHRQNQNPARR
jgi:hypothetical protein